MGAENGAIQHQAFQVYNSVFCIFFLNAHGVVKPLPLPNSRISVLLRKIPVSIDSYPAIGPTPGFGRLLNLLPVFTYLWLLSWPVSHQENWGQRKHNQKGMACFVPCLGYSEIFLLEAGPHRSMPSLLPPFIQCKERGLKSNETICPNKLSPSSLHQAQRALPWDSCWIRSWKTWTDSDWQLSWAPQKCPVHLGTLTSWSSEIFLYLNRNITWVLKSPDANIEVKLLNTWSYLSETYSLVKTSYCLHYPIVWVYVACHSAGWCHPQDLSYYLSQYMTHQTTGWCHSMGLWGIR